MTNPLKQDPTRTKRLQKQFDRDINRRFLELEKLLDELIVKDDAFNLSKKTSQFKLEDFFETNQENFSFYPTDGKLAQFERWLKDNIGKTIVNVDEVPDDWWKKYIQQGYEKGTKRAFKDANKKAQVQTDESFFSGMQFEFTTRFLNAPESINKVKLLASRVLDGLRSVSTNMIGSLKRHLLDGLVQGDNPRAVARRIKDTLRISKNRSETIARTELIRAHAEGQLDTLEKMGVEEVGVMVEWATAGDERVCTKCKPLGGIVLKVKEAHGLIPRHPNCRCAFMPANVGESEKDQIRDAKEIRKRIKTSKKLDGKNSQWAYQKRIATKRPEQAKVFEAETAKEEPKKVFEAETVAPIKSTEELLEEKRLSLIDQVESQPITKQLHSIYNKLNEKFEKQIPELYQQANSAAKQIEAQSKLKVDTIEELDAKEKKLKLLWEDYRFLKDAFEKARKEGKKNKLLLQELNHKALAKTLSLSEDRRTSIYVDTALGGNETLVEITDKALKKLLPYVDKDLLNSALPDGIIKVRTAEEGREYSILERDLLGITKKTTQSTLWHEIAHLLENDKSVRELAIEFRDNRTRPREGVRPQAVALRKLFPKSKYKQREVTFGKDDWEKLFQSEKRAYYVGKYYGYNEPTEIISMGVQKLNDDAIHFAKVDPEYFKLIVGILDGSLLKEKAAK